MLAPALFSTLLLATLVQSFARSSPSFALWLACFGVILAVLEWARRRRLLVNKLERTWPWWAGSLALLLSPPLRSVAEHEGLFALAPRMQDRIAITSLPAIAPALRRTDQPQSFFVQVDEDARVVWIELEGALHTGQALGHGLFRIEVPSSHQPSATTVRETMPVTIRVDGRDTSRAMLGVTPRAHPGRAGVRGSDVCIVSEETDSLRLGRAGAALTAPLDTGDGPVGCAFNTNGVLVALRYEDHLFELPSRDPSTRAQRAHVGRGSVALEAGPSRLGVLIDGQERALLQLDPEGTQVVVRTMLEGVPVDLVAIDAGFVVATRSPAALHFVDLEGEVRASLALRVPARALAASPEVLVIATTDFGPADRDNRGNHFVDDQLVFFELAALTQGPGAAFAASRIEHTARRTARQDHAGDVDSGLGPTSLAFAADGTLFVAFAGSFELGATPARGLPHTVELREVLGMPTFVRATAEGLLVLASVDSATAWVSPSLEMRRVERWEPDDRALLLEDPEALRLRMGERSFLEATRAGVSCESCHPSHATDGARHNIGGRILAPTLDVRGLEGTSPFLRDGSYPHLGDLYEVALSEYRGFRRADGDRRSTLDMMLRTLPGPVSTAARDPAREARGLDAFYRAGCQGCHAPPAFTNLSRHAARALFPDAQLSDESISLDVPSLRHLRHSAPYLFDGRAASIRDLLVQHNRSNRHGDTAALDQRALDDLVFFLESL